MKRKKFNPRHRKIALIHSELSENISKYAEAKNLAISSSNCNFEARNPENCDRFRSKKFSWFLDPSGQSESIEIQPPQWFGRKILIFLCEKIHDIDHINKMFVLNEFWEEEEKEKWTHFSMFDVRIKIRNRNQNWKKW